MAAIFCLGYLCIVLEHTINVDKAASAILTGVLCWTVYVMAAPSLVDPALIPADFGDYAIWTASSLTTNGNSYTVTGSIGTTT